ncbi:MAG: hypothetical protein HKN41_12345 [Ilumatobacter sp.]|nr:hypothetical protein [Ilumatobacter sp.]
MPASADSTTRRRRSIAGAAAAVCLLAACGVDAGVSTMSAEPTGQSGDPTGVGPDDDAAIGSEPALPTTDAPVDDGTTDAVPEPPPSTTTTPVEPTLPSIVVPELNAQIPIADVVDVDDGKPARDYDDFVAVALTDIERWWNEVFPQVYGVQFDPLEGGVYAGYPERTSALPGCGERTTDYQDLQQFVAFYCQLGDFMVYDDMSTDVLLPLAEEFGPAVMGIVLAHEYGHAIQARVGALDRFLATILTEQQADCFAGAWTGQAYGGDSDLLRLGDADVRAGLIAMLSVRDPVGTNQFQPGGHGSAFDRVGAFQVGFLEGPARCAELLDEPLTLMPNAFQLLSDLERGGNASYDCSDDPDPDCRPAPEFLAEDLDHFWSVALGGGFEPVTPVAVDDPARLVCADGVPLADEVVVCPVDRTVLFDEPEIRVLYDEFGDFTIGYFYGIAWAELVQLEVGSDLDGEPRALLSDCYTGAWVRDITPDSNNRTPRNADLDGDGEPDSTVRSSPGDLDEAIRMAILEGDDGANENVVGTAFEKIAAFRVGVLGGLTACDAEFG